MHIHTVEMNYDHRMKQAIVRLLKDWNMTTVDFGSNEELMQFLEIHANELGAIVVQDMIEFSDSWKDDIHSETFR